MLFAQMTYRESLRDIQACLRSQARFLCAMGIHGSACRSNLAYVNERRDWRVFFELAGILMQKARKQYSKDRYNGEIDLAVDALDASVVVTKGKVHDVNALDWIVFEAGAFYAMDRRNLDFG